MNQPATPRKIGWISATAIVVANMVGTGVFTSLGFQLVDLQHTWTIILLWIIGGLIALFGAISYAELGTRLPQSGGEYYFLSKIYHPFIGYLSGWVSLTVGFAASIALAAMAMGAYFKQILQIEPTFIAITVILITTTIHSFNLNQSRNFQNLITILKTFLLLFLIVAGFYWGTEAHVLKYQPGWFSEVKTPAFAIALVYVTYSYSGWNAAAYIVGEIKTPRKNLPRALILGTALVAAIYVGLQVMFLWVAPIQELKGQIEVGQIVANLLFGKTGGNTITLLIGMLLMSSISAMIWVGPRVVRAMADDHQIWSFLAADNKNKIPVRAVWLQTFISIILILSSSFEQVLIYSGFVLQLFNTLTVAGVIVLRMKNKGSSNDNFFLSPLYPYIQISYILISLWILIFLLTDRPVESLLGLANLLIGGVSYWVSKKSASENAPLPQS